MIHASVGEGGRNFREDVEVIQRLLKTKGYALGPVDCVCGPKTVDAIRRFQTKFMQTPDGLIIPRGPTWRHLAATQITVAQVHAVTSPLPEWAGDSAHWSQEKKLRSMTPLLRPKVQAVLSALLARGFQPKIFFGWRSVAVQLELYDKGRSKVKFSFHNAQQKDGTPNSYAADIIDQRYGWEPLAKTSGFWKALGEEAKTQELYWGGDWKSFPDEAHVQLVANSQLSHIKTESGL